METNLLNKILSNLKIENLNEMQTYLSDVYDETDDIVLLSPTGSGKTLAFLLPLVNNLNVKDGAVKALILAPSRELSLQIEDVFKSMQTGIRIGSCYGGHSAGYEERMLENPPAVIVGTPGRIKDHVERGRIDLKTIDTLVLDEFDNSLEFGFSAEMSFIIENLINVKKKILLSATEMEEIPDFANLYNPFKINFLSETETLDGLKVKKIISPNKDKVDILFNLICEIDNEQSIIFCNYRDAAERVANFLKRKGIDCKTYHGGLDQREREKALCCFRNGSSNILISTDLASRGLDIPDVKHVIHYHLPANQEAYTHRNGRTARMFAEGYAYIILNSEETMPSYIDNNLIEDYTPSNCTKIPSQTDWITIYIGKGKRDKISKGDVAGFLMQKGKLSKDDLGKIELKDHYCYAAIKRNKAKNTLNLIAGEKIKGIKTIFEEVK